MNYDRGNDFYWQENARHVHDGWWGGPLHAIFALLLIAVLVLGVIWFARRLLPAANQAAGPGVVPAAAPLADPAVTTLRMRYAKGEVSREDFQTGIADLTGAAAAAATESTWPAAGADEDATPTAS